MTDEAKAKAKERDRPVTALEEIKDLIEVELCKFVRTDDLAYEAANEFLEKLFNHKRINEAFSEFLKISMNATLRRMLNTPPKQHKKSKDKILVQSENDKPNDKKR